MVTKKTKKLLCYLDFQVFNLSYLLLTSKCFNIEVHSLHLELPFLHVFPMFQSGHFSIAHVFLGLSQLWGLVPAPVPTENSRPFLASYLLLKRFVKPRLWQGLWKDHPWQKEFIPFLNSRKTYLGLPLYHVFGFLLYALSP